MKRKWIAAFLTCVMVFALSVTAFAATPAATAAQKLDDLGLFQGMGNNADGTPNYGLDQIPTRAQAVTMLVRLLGKEQEAQNSTYSAPFTDVADWAKPYVNYAYKNGLTNGTSATTFGGNAAIKPTEYLTFVLRALGYTSGTDFQWNSAWTLTDKLGVTSGEYNANTTAFTRGNVASISFDALSASKKNTTTPLYQSLINAGVFTEAQAESAGLKEGNTSTTKVEATSVKLNQTSVTLEEGETVALSATVRPSNATDKSVTWSSSRTSVATVSSTGTVTAEGEGTATITAKTANGKTATCTVKVEKAAEAQNFTVPKLNYEYGPFTAECHFSTGNYWYTTQVDSLVFTKCEMTNIGKYKIAVSIQGTSDFDTTGIIANFYDSNNRVLDEVRLTARVPGNNQPFNVLDETYVERETIENAVRIEFYDVNGSPVSYGGSSSGNNNSNNNTDDGQDEDNTSSNVQEALQIAVKLNTYFQQATTASGMGGQALEVAGSYPETGASTGRDQAMGVVRRYLEQRQGLAQDVADAIGDNQEFAKVRSMALEVARLDGSLAARCGSNMSRAEVLSIFEGFNEGTRQWGELVEEATSVVEQFSK